MSTKATQRLERSIVAAVKKGDSPRATRLLAIRRSVNPTVPDSEKELAIMASPAANIDHAIAHRFGPPCAAMRSTPRMGTATLIG